MLLRSAVGMAAPQATVPALGAAELVGAALEAFATDADLLAAERGAHQAASGRRRAAPRSAGRPAGAGVVGRRRTHRHRRRPQPVGIRLPRCRSRAAARRRAGVILTESHRCAPAVARRHHRESRGGCRVPTRAPCVDGRRRAAGSVTVRIAASPHAESALIADALRRAHLVDGVPWSQMAVIVRSVPRLGATLARALAAAGVPVDLPPPSAPLAEQPAVRALLTVLDATAGGLDGDAGAVTADRADRPGRPGVAASAATGAAPRRWHAQPPREFADLLVEALEQREPEGCPPNSRRPLQRVRAVLAAARRSAADGLRSPLHAVAGLASVRSAAALAGGQRTRRSRRCAGRSRPRRRHRAVRRRRAVRHAHRRRVAARSGRPRHGARPTPAPATNAPSPTRWRCSARIRARQGVGVRRHRRTAGRAVAQHDSPRRRTRHPAARRRDGRRR